MDEARLFSCADKYQIIAYRTANKSLDSETELTVGSLGLAGEAGEAGECASLFLELTGAAGRVAEIRKKNLGHGRELDETLLKDELGDVLWYVALICTNRGWSLADIMQANIEKLVARWPEGFTAPASPALPVAEDSTKPIWEPCPDGCGDFICNVHGMHVADCPCPGIDVWAAQGKDPYFPEG